MGGGENPSVANQTATAGEKLIIGFFQDEVRLPGELVGRRLHSADNLGPGIVIRPRRIAAHSVDTCQTISPRSFEPSINVYIYLNDTINESHVPFHSGWPPDFIGRKNPSRQSSRLYRQRRNQFGITFHSYYGLDAVGRMQESSRNQEED